MKKYIILSILLSILLSSCENEIPFDLKNNPPKMIVNTYMEAENDVHYITLALTGVSGVKYINEGAKISVFLNGVLKEEITKSVSIKGLYKSNLKFNDGDLVKIIARTDDGKYEVWAEERVATPITIERVDTASTKQNENYYANRIMRFKTVFTDVPGQKNYYRIVMEKYQEVTAKSVATDADTIVIVKSIQHTAINDDIVLTDGRPQSTNEENNILPEVANRYSVFDDSRLNGQYSMSTSFYYVPLESLQFNSDGIKEISKIEYSFRIKLMSINEKEYLYLRALSLYFSDSYDEVLGIPIKFPTNINNGTGIAAISAASTHKISIYTIIPQ